MVRLENRPKINPHNGCQWTCAQNDYYLSQCAYTQPHTCIVSLTVLHLLCRMCGNHFSSALYIFAFFIYNIVIHLHCDGWQRFHILCSPFHSRFHFCNASRSSQSTVQQIVEQTKTRVDRTQYTSFLLAIVKFRCRNERMDGLTIGTVIGAHTHSLIMKWLNSWCEMFQFFLFMATTISYMIGNFYQPTTLSYLKFDTVLCK